MRQESKGLHAWLGRLIRRCRRSAARIVASDGTELHWDRFDDFDAACADVRTRLRAGTIGIAWQPTTGRRTVIVRQASQLPQARRLARAAGWSAMRTRYELLTDSACTSPGVRVAG